MAPEENSSSPESRDADFNELLGETREGANSELDETLEAILLSVERVIRYDTASIMLRRGNALEIRAARGFADPASVIGFRFKLSAYPIQAGILESNSPTVLADANSDERWQGDNTAPGSADIRAWIGIPLRGKKGPIGILTLDSHKYGVFDKTDLELAQAFADEASVAIQNARLLGETRRRMLELSAVGKIGAAASSRLDVDGLCEVVGENLATIFGTGVVYISLYDSATGLISTPFFRAEGRDIPVEPYPVGGGLTSLVLDRKEALLIQRHTDRLLRDYGAIQRFERPPKSWLGVPILARGEAIGVLSVQDLYRENAFTTDDVRLLETLSSTVSVSIQNAFLYEEAKTFAAETSTLLEIGREISSTLVIDDVLALIVDKARKVMCKDTAAVYLVDEADASILRAAAAAGVSAHEIMPERIRIGDGIIGSTAAAGRPEIINNTFVDPRSVHIAGTEEDEDGEKLMTAPLVSPAGVIGVMAIWRSADEPAFSRADNAFLEGLARQASVAIQNAQSYSLAKTARAEAEEANKTKSHFLANMSHELRTPLNSIINFAYLLVRGTEGSLSEGQRDLVARIEDSGTHLLGLINDILDLAKIESGRMELYVEDTDLKPLIEGVISTAIGLIGDKPISLDLELAPKLPVVAADRTRIRQVLLNLISNAAKFTNKGRILVRARTDEFETTISVEDSGIGIEPEDIEKSFAEFVQIDSGPDRLAGGTGLGLPISKHFVEMHGGKIWATSEPGKGSIFSFTLPNRRISAGRTPGALPEIPLPQDSAATHADPHDILVIDEDPSSADIISDSLSDDYRVIMVQDSRQAVDAVKRKRPAAIVLDVMMPRYDGRDILKELKNDPETKDIPVIICSVVNERRLAYSLHADECLLKPIDRDNLLRIVERLIPKGGTILAVDDDENALEIVRRVLDICPWKVRSATDGFSGLEQMSEDRPDAVILDLMMPGMSGFEVLERMRTDPRLADIPVVVLTAKDLSPAEREILGHDANAWINKGGSIGEELERALAKILPHRA
ncbi:MAG: GAF domain-containing protein [Spirochaetes bacterium]|nr:GAF domain-containing protein [Spirochaetota bacterium]